MPRSDDLNQLLLQVGLSNRKAFKQLYNLTAAKLFAVSLRITKQQGLSEEILQESYIKIWHHAKSFDPDKSQAMTWMGTIVRHQSIDAMRKYFKYEHTSAEDDGVLVTEAIEDNPEQLALRQGQLSEIEHCLGLLNEKQRSLIAMAYIEGYSYQEIAEIKTVPIGSVKTWIHRGIAEMRTCLNRLKRK